MRPTAIPPSIYCTHCATNIYLIGSGSNRQGRVATRQYFSYRHAMSIRYLAGSLKFAEFAVLYTPEIFPVIL
jgi:hypothetical protein